MKTKLFIVGFIAIVLVIATIASVVIISDNGSSRNPIGNLVLLGAMFFFVWTIILVNRLKNAEEQH